MNTGDLAPLQALIRLRRVDANLLPTDRAVLENFLLEERVQPSRLQVFAAAIGLGPWLDVDAFGAVHRNDYLRERIDLDQGDPAIPDTFDSGLNGSNFWSGIEENLALYRLEAASFALKGSGVDEAELERAVAERNRTGRLQPRSMRSIRCWSGCAKHGTWAVTAARPLPPPSPKSNTCFMTPETIGPTRCAITRALAI